MPAAFTAEEIMAITEARIAVGLMHEDVGEICTDTRTLKEGQWFLALRGEEFDGHDFLGEAYSSGAIGCIVEERTSYPIASTSFPLLAVPDTADALSQLARNWRKRINPRVALLPASESLEALVETLGEGLAKYFEGRFVLLEKSDCVEVCKHLLQMPDDTRAVLIQYKLNHFEETEVLGFTALPGVVLLTEESVRAFRLRLSSADLAAMPFAIMPTLKLSHGLLIVDASFKDQLFENVDASFLRNVIVFGDGVTEADFASGNAAEFLRAGGDDEQTEPMLVKAREYAIANSPSDEYFELYEVTAVILMMMGIEFAVS